MLQFSPAALLAGIQAGLDNQAADLLAGEGLPRLCIAYSGGLDSTVLLHAAARLYADHPDRLRAVHVDHQLQADSARWRAHCEAIAARLEVAFQGLAVKVPRQPQQGLEAAARAARYGALEGVLASGELLLTAHHADDQLETVLLALMRGAGLRGLSAMAPGQRFAGGWLVRPLLGFTRAALEAWARQERLAWLVDPSNAESRFDRNYLRHRILPLLRERWPAAAHCSRRSAAHLREAGVLLDALASQDCTMAAVGDCLDVEVLRSLEPERRRNLLRHWIRLRGLLAPSTRKLAAIEHDLLQAREDRIPCVCWQGGQLRRHGGLVYALRPRTLPEAAFAPLPWRITEPLVLPGALGCLRLERQDSPVDASSTGASGRPALALARLEATLEVRTRRGGETLRPAGDLHQRSLKKLLHSRGILPWWRAHVPLIYSAGSLVAVADLWVAQEYAAGEGEPAGRIVWREGPDLLSSMRGLG